MELDGISGALSPDARGRRDRRDRRGRRVPRDPLVQPARKAPPVRKDRPATSDRGFGTNAGGAAAGNGAECTLGQILLSASPGVTVGGVPANGQILSIAQNTALFSLIGTTYGGDGVSTFALPDLRSVTPNNMTYSICDQGI